MFQFAVTNMIMKASMNVWGSCRLRDLGKWAAGSAFPLEYQGNVGLEYLFCKVGDMNRPGNEVYIHSTENTIDDYIADRIKAKIHSAGTVIFPKIGGAIATNKRRILIKDSAIDNNCLGIIPNENTDSEWLLHFLSSVDFSRYQSGTSVPSLRQSVLGNIEAPLMPNNIQKQVAIFLTWFKDKSPADRWDNSPPLPSELQEQKRIVARMGRLITRAEKARKLRVEAVEEAEGLFASILSRMYEINRTDYPIEFLENIAEKIADINHKMPKAVEKGVKFISPKDFTPNGINFNNCKKISENDFDRLRKKIQPQKGDILYSRIGTVGQARLVDTDEDFLASYSIVTIRPNSKKCLSKYLLFALRAPTILGHAKVQVRAIAMPDLGIGKIRKFQIPLPPLPAQHRIVAYLDSLQEKVNELKKLQDENGEQIKELIPSILNNASEGDVCMHAGENLLQ